MTNEEAIEHLKNINRRYPSSLDSTFREECEQIAINLAIKALKFQDQFIDIVAQAVVNAGCDSFEEFCEKCGIEVNEDDTEQKIE